jgi:hypothetical protein
MASYITEVKTLTENEKSQIVPSDIGEFNDFVATPPLSNDPGLDEGSQLVELNSSFIFNGNPHNKLYISANGFISFKHLFNTLGAGTGNDHSGIYLLQSDLYATPTPQEYIKYKVTNDRFVVVYNTSLYGQNETSLLIKVTFYLSNSPESGKIVIEYGDLVFNSVYYMGITFDEGIGKPFDTSSMFNIGLNSIELNQSKYKPYKSSEDNPKFKRITFTPTEKDISFDQWIIPLPLDTNNKTFIIPRPVTNRTGPIEYTSNPYGIVSINNSTGEMTILNRGETTVTATQTVTLPNGVTYTGSTSYSLQTAYMFESPDDVYKTVITSHLLDNSSLEIEGTSIPGESLDLGSYKVTLTRPFVIYSQEYFDVYINYNGGIFFSRDSSASEDQIITPFRKDLYTISPEYIKYKENSDNFVVVYKTSQFGKPSTDIFFKITLQLKNNKDSGTVKIEFGEVVFDGFYDTHIRFTTDNNATVNVRYDLFTNNRIPLNASIRGEYTVNPSKKVITMTPILTPTLASLMIPSENETVRIPITYTDTNSDGVFTTTSLSPSVATVENTTDGTFLVIKRVNEPITLTTTQAESGIYRSVTFVTELSASYFTFIQTPTLSSNTLTIPSKNVRRRIPITHPTSNSEGVFTTTSLTPSVATVENTPDGSFLVIKQANEPITLTTTQAASGNYRSVTFVTELSASYFTFISDICFPAGTLVLTDQGSYPIETLDGQTIGGNKIVCVTKTISSDSHLICFEKDALSEEVPSQRTVMTQKHKVLHEGTLTYAMNLLNDTSVHTQPYEGEPLYNVLLEEHSVMNIHGLICETLHPTSVIAKFHSKSLTE